MLQRDDRPTRSNAPVAGRALSAIAGVFLLFDAISHLLRPHVVLQSFADLGFPESLSRPLGALELICLVLYALRPTTVLGAVLLTGYLGGAVSAHARVQDSLWGQTMFPVYLGVLLWTGLWLRDVRVQALLPVRRVRSGQRPSQSTVPDPRQVTAGR